LLVGARSALITPNKENLIREIKNNLTQTFKKRKSKTIRSCVIPVRLTPEERDKLKEIAESHHVSISELIRRFSLRRKLPAPIPEINIKTYRELAAVGNNLNQMVKELYIGLFRGVDENFFHDLKKLIQRTSLELMGIS